MEHLDLAALQDGLAHIRDSPANHGRVELIVRRPAVDEREVIVEATLDSADGLLGDTWKSRSGAGNGTPNREVQLTLMNARAAALVARTEDRRQLAGDQLYVDFDLSIENLPPGTRLSVGSAVIEVTEEPHTGCGKFSKRFGVDALKFVNSVEGRALRLRGMNARIVVGGVVRPGDSIAKAGD